MKDRFHSTAPFIPKEAIFNECANRESEEITIDKPKNVLAALLGNQGPD